MKKRTKKPEPRKVYRPMPGCRYSDTQVQTIGKELDRISLEQGCVKPSVLVKASQEPDAPLHEYFTWDDAIAGHKFRENEARNLIRVVRIVEDDGLPEAEKPVFRAFVSVKAKDTETRFSNRAYIRFAEAMSDEEYKQQTYADAKRELVLWSQRYRDLKDFGVKFSSLWKGVDSLVSK